MRLKGVFSQWSGSGLALGCTVPAESPPSSRLNRLSKNTGLPLYPSFPLSDQALSFLVVVKMDWKHKNKIHIAHIKAKFPLPPTPIMFTSHTFTMPLIWSSCFSAWEERSRQGRWIILSNLKDGAQIYYFTGAPQAKCHQMPLYLTLHLIHMLS